ncbi:MAG: hypothetical protein E7445_07800 [Ruminococcaceae bacterium]|nr:hypothetical protein [Oscillospiraceae bacterium]
MKRYLRLGAMLLCALLMLSEIPAAQATGTVYFTAVNETVLKLSESTMPFWANSSLYVSSDMFADKELGITYYNNVVTRMATLYQIDRALQFDLEKGTATDGDGAPVSGAALVRNGRVFFPVQMVVDFFELTYSNTAVNRGYVVRLRSDDSVLNDRLFLDAATSLLEYRYEEYEKEKASVTIPVTPVTPPDNPKPPEPPVSDERTVYLSFLATENSEGLLDVLSRADIPATFFFTEEQLKTNAAFARRLVVTGYGIGLAADGGQESDVAEQLRSANQLLWRMTGTKTRLCLLENAGAEDEKMAGDAGYCCLKAAVDRSKTGLPESGANDLYKAIHRQTGDTVTVWLADGVTPAGLQAFLKLADSNGDLLAALTELVLKNEIYK